MTLQEIEAKGKELRALREKALREQGSVSLEEARAQARRSLACSPAIRSKVHTALGALVAKLGKIISLSQLPRDSSRSGAVRLSAITGLPV